MRAIAFSLVAAVTLAAGPARAQQYILGASAEVGTGIERGAGHGAPGFRRARTTLRLGADARLDEDPRDAWTGALCSRSSRRPRRGSTSVTCGW